MRTQHLLIMAGLAAVLAAPAQAQSIKKIGDEAHHVLKKTGNGIKQGVKDAGSATHHVLKKAGNETKTAAGDVTGVHKVGGTVGDVAQGVSRTGKHIGRSAKHSLKKNKAKAHADLTKEGKETKATIKPEK